ncbi:MAG: alpha/beta fold hydrolase [Mycobacteriaceae bacterium]|nr:alpha/beta fold hydrolase [Mycobacteriaceae bacterium]MBV9641854.1 alpha/beta fold hydrolase [Mycobacteriaceae bacterium]
MQTRWLLLHGTPLSPEVFDGVRPHLPTPTAVPDLDTLIPAAGSAHSLQRQIATKVLAALPDEGDLVVVGHSFGGQVAIELALQAPRRVTRLIIVCSRHTPFPAFARGARAVRAGAPFDIDADLARWFTPQQLAADPPVIAYLRRRLATAPRGPWAASLDAIAHYDRSTEVGHIAAPTRLFAAGHDEVATPQVMTQLAETIPDARLQIVPGWAHMSPFADPAAFGTLLGDAAR